MSIDVVLAVLGSSVVTQAFNSWRNRRKGKADLIDLQTQTQTKLWELYSSLLERVTIQDTFISELKVKHQECEVKAEKQNRELVAVKMSLAVLEQKYTQEGLTNGITSAGKAGPPGP